MVEYVLYGGAVSIGAAKLITCAELTSRLFDEDYRACLLVRYPERYTM